MAGLWTTFSRQHHSTQFQNVRTYLLCVLLQDLVREFPLLPVEIQFDGSSNVLHLSLDDVAQFNSCRLRAISFTGENFVEHSSWVSGLETSLGGGRGGKEGRGEERED